MRQLPTNVFEQEELDELRAEQWQIDLLELNPSYVWWGNHEDCMTGGQSWMKSLEYDSWTESGFKSLDNYNEVVNFYFELSTNGAPCHVRLQLWVLHPRKGASRGVLIKEIKQHELPEVFAFLRQAADRNANRFSKIPNP